jgi:hypothetical protein
MNWGIELSDAFLNPTLIDPLHTNETKINFGTTLCYTGCY